MRRAAAVLGLSTALVSAAPAQEPTVSPALARLAQRDTMLAVWFFGRDDVPLDRVADAVVSSGGTVRRRSRWLHAVSGDVPTGALALAGRRAEFRHLQPVATFRRPADPPPDPDIPRAAALTVGPSAMPFRRLGLSGLVDRGVRGEGVTIAVFDTGFETGLSAFDSATVLDQYDFVFDDTDVGNEPEDDPSASRHGTQSWSLLAANVPTQMIGIAPRARYLLAKTEDVRAEVRTEEDDYVAALEWAEARGAEIVSSSLVYLDFDDGFAYDPEDLDGDVAVTTVAADAAAARGVLVVTAAGNAGPAYRTVLTPADGDSVIAVGAEDSLGVLAPFSSRGPTADGRLKPDFVAPGVRVFVVDPASATGFSRADGTSFSTPLITGAAALFREVHPTLPPMEIRDALRGAASSRAAPDSAVGWGRPDASAATFYPRGVVVASPSDSLLDAATPTFAWSVPELPAVAGPVGYRLRVGRDAGFAVTLLDTVVTDPVVTLLDAQRPGARLVLEIVASTEDSVTLSSGIRGEFVAPPWAVLTTLDDPEGSTARDLRPVFRWQSPGIATPPGPFTYDVVVIRDADGTVEVAGTDLATPEFVPSRDLERNTPYRWKVITRLGVDSAVTESQSTFIIVDDSVPTVTLLYQNFPNPFPRAPGGSDATCLWFDLATGGPVRLEILDLRGHRVTTLVPGGGLDGTLEAGRYGRPGVGDPGTCDPRLAWDGRAHDGSAVPRGIYLARLGTPDGVFFRRIVFLGTRR